MLLPFLILLNYGVVVPAVTPASDKKSKLLNAVAISGDKAIIRQQTQPTIVTGTLQEEAVPTTEVNTTEETTPVEETATSDEKEEDVVAETKSVEVEATQAPEVEVETATSATVETKQAVLTKEDYGLPVSKN